MQDGQSSSSSSLQDRLRQLRKVEQRQELLLRRNWDQGHWSQHVIPLMAPMSCLLASPTVVDHQGEPMLVVGDVVGQIHFIRPKFLSATNSSTALSSWIQETTTISTFNVTTFPIVAMAYIPDDIDNAILCASSKGLFYLNHQEDHAIDDDSIDKKEKATSTDSTRRPLLLVQEDMSSLMDLYVSESDEDNNDLYYIIAVFPNRIQIYHLSLSNDESNSPAAVVLQQHTSTIAIQDAKPWNDDDESFWNVDRETIRITSSTYDAKHGRLYLGLSSGYVYQYGMQFEPQQSPSCYCQFRWKINSLDTAITAIAQSSPIMVNRRQEMEIIFTGDDHGTVQQWGIVEDSNTDHPLPEGRRRRFLWPQMAKQKLPNRAHSFGAHQQTITQIVPIDDQHFVSASKDGDIRAWNAKTGAGLFLLTGFSDHVDEQMSSSGATTGQRIHTAVWNDSAMVTALGKTMTIHQFNIDTPSDFDLDMPEYRST